MSGRRPSAPEFSRPVAADSISSHLQRREITAEPAERKALAQRFGLLSLNSLGAVLELHREAGDVIHVSGHLSADVVQSCVVSLVPVPAHIETNFELGYGGPDAGPDEGDIEPTGIDAPEPLVDGEIDLGEAVAQQLAIALDPYPRAPDAGLGPEGFTAGQAETGGKQPFAALAALKKRD